MSAPTRFPDGSQKVVDHRELFIGGRMVAPSGQNVIEVISPHSEMVVGRTPDGAPADIDAAVAAARSAMSGEWGRSSVAERVDVMKRLLAECRRRSDEYGRAQVLEMGCPISQVNQVMVGPALEHLEYYSDLIAGMQFEELRSGAGGSSVVRQKPVGVVGAILPWNGPPALTMMKLAPALAAGCAMVLKPAPEAPLDSYVLADAAMAAGLPDGVLNIVPGGRELGEYLVTHAGVDKISFTGSSAAGQRIGALCGERHRPVTLELGGKSAAIVLHDAELTTTVEGLAFNSFLNNGQVCAADSRILLPASRFDEFTDAIVAMVAGFTVGDPFDPETFVGPLVSQRQRERVEGYLAKGIAEGARVVVGGGRPPNLPRGWYVEPTVFVDVKPSMTIAREEIFGPVITLLAYTDEDEALAIANDTDYGLAGSIWTADVAHALELSARVTTGIVAINTFGCQPCTPFGGVKRSGIGREGGPEGLSAYLYSQSILMG
ncbi:aldehyde dehydrogenase [Mycobacterium sp.]|jgi:aldehyde dehydrogenase (NAD+)|uniref:aldehyde dehydrogenase n=1 Tax=Mycobacterium sp. TaxID=1785 RepID=UPI002CE93DBE|nr:aldehyde dehydrogenase [Mycobacterium sp.]HXB86028.1 aldehyde dehydrogenase [Mycobacterium sp.]